MLFHSSRNNGKDGYVAGRSSTAPQVCATGRLSAPARLLKLMVIFSTHTMLEPVQNLRNFVNFSSSIPRT